MTNQPGKGLESLIPKKSAIYGGPSPRSPRWSFGEAGRSPLQADAGGPQESKKEAVFFFLLILFGLGIAQPLFAQTEDFSLPGRTEGTGIFFEITDSEYLNISLASSEEIKVVLESVPKTISLILEASSVASSAGLTITGLEPNATYYKYEDSYKNETVIVSDISGIYHWTQDISQPHHIWFQPKSSTIFIPSQCSQYGVWDEATSTCILTKDLTQSVQLSSGTVLDCNSHTISGGDSGYGIYVPRSDGNTIKNCGVSNFSYGIYLWGGSNHTLTKDNVLNNFHGVVIGGAHNNTIADNTINSNSGYGLLVDSVLNNTLQRNAMFQNRWNFRLWGSGDPYYANNIDTSNTVEGKPIYYILNAANQTYDNSTNAGVLYCIFCDHIIVRDLVLKSGVFLWKTNNSTLDNITASNHLFGIWLQYSNNNSIRNSILDANDTNGLFLAYSSNNTVTGSAETLNNIGIRLHNSQGNTFIDNTVRDNTRAGASIYYFSTAHFYHNNFINNSIQAEVIDWSGASFDNGYPANFDPALHGGNFWSDYTGIDEKRGSNQDQLGPDWIGDAPHIFTGGLDRYPWMEQDGWRVPTNQPPTFSNQSQYKSDGVTIIPEEQRTIESTVIFKALLNDPDNDQVKFQIELKEFNQSFDETNLIESDFAPSGQQPLVIRYGLVDGQYHWRARVIDARGAGSGWQEFGGTGNVDFAVKLVPLYTQVRSPYPSEKETLLWSELDYAEGAIGNYDCGSKIRECGCAITSSVMVLRYYDVLTADNEDVNPGSINNWLNVHQGYSEGAVNWLKVAEYSGYKIKFDTEKSGDYLNNYVVLNEYLNNNRPAIAKEKAGRGGINRDHFIVINNKLAATYGVKDPALYNTQKLNESTDIVNKIRGYDNGFDGLRLFYPSDGVAISAISFILSSSAELLVTDPSGRRLGKDPINQYDEIPNGTYLVDAIDDATGVLLPREHETQEIYISSPEDGSYDIKAIGTDTGSYDLDVLIYDRSGESATASHENTIELNVTHSFELDYSPQAIQQTEFYRIVDIDIKPGSDLNAVNCKNQNGVITVAVLSNQFFDASIIDPTTVRFGPNGAQEIHRDRNGNPKRHLQDVDNDGDIDALFHFRFGDSGLQCNNAEATLAGTTFDGLRIKGIDAIRMVGESSLRSKYQSQLFAMLSFSFNSAPELLYGVLNTISGFIRGLAESLSQLFGGRATKEQKEVEISTKQECVDSVEEVQYEIREKERTLGDVEADIIVKVTDKDKNLQRHIFQINNIFKNYHPIEIHKCGVYVIRFSNYDPQKVKEWTGFKSEVWKYSYDGQGDNLVLLSEEKEGGVFLGNYSYDFRVDPSEGRLVLERGYPGKDGYALVIKDLKTKEDIFVLSAKDIFQQYPDIIGNFNMREWSKDGRYFWGNIFDGAYVTAYFRIDTQNWKYDIYEAPDGAMGGFPPNINTGYVPIQPGQIWTGDYQLTQELKERYRREGKTSSLYLYNLFTKEKILIETVDEPLWSFKPKWFSDTELQYELPNGEKKIYTISQ